jgi:hypothetical protein
VRERRFGGLGDVRNGSAGCISVRVELVQPSSPDAVGVPVSWSRMLFALVGLVRSMAKTGIVSGCRMDGAESCKASHYRVQRALRH